MDKLALGGGRWRGLARRDEEYRVSIAQRRDGQRRATLGRAEKLECAAICEGDGHRTGA